MLYHFLMVNQAVYKIGLSERVFYFLFGQVELGLFFFLSMPMSIINITKRSSLSCVFQKSFRSQLDDDFIYDHEDLCNANVPHLCNDEDFTCKDENFCDSKWVDCMWFDLQESRHGLKTYNSNFTLKLELNLL